MVPDGREYDVIGKAIALSVLVAWSGAGHAAVFAVTSTVDAADNAPGNGICASAANGCTLRAAVQEANALAGEDSISAPIGQYVLTLGTLTLSTRINLFGAGPGSVIDGNGVGPVLRVNAGANGPVSIDGVTVRNGASPTDAGGIRIDNTTLLKLSNALVAENTAIVGSGQGGGIFVDSFSSVWLDGTTVRDNTCTNGGCGVRVRSSATALILKSTISNNVATGNGTGGAGIESQGVLVLTNSTVSGNSNAKGSAGGVYAGSSGTVDIVYSTFIGNGPASAQLVRATATTQVLGSLFAGAPAGTANCAGTLVSQGRNLDTGTSCNFGIGSLNNVADPKVGPLADNGGATRTHALLPGSPAIDAADTACPESVEDQREIPRPQGAACDIGAYESDSLFQDGFE